MAHRLILATGGQSLPKTGSDGHGYTIARSLGHTVTRALPALVPLTLPGDDYLRTLSGIAVPATLTVTAPNAYGKFKPVASFTGPTLLTHFGLSGPAVLDISRYYLDANAQDRATLFINFLPGLTTDQFDGRLHRAGRSEGALTVHRFVSSLIPDRLAHALCVHCGVDPATRLSNLTVNDRRRLALATTNQTLPVTGSRGYTYAEATAGGVPLSELHLETMESRICPGLFVCGEICDVDGRIGGFNFQWAWASGFVAGTAAASSTP